jgi:hypothetical protein
MVLRLVAYNLSGAIFGSPTSNGDSITGMGELPGEFLAQIDPTRS